MKFICFTTLLYDLIIHLLIGDGEKYEIPANNKVELTPGHHQIPKYPSIKDSLISRNQKEAKKRVFVESSDGEFFGLNTTIFRTDGLIGGMYKKLANYYDDTAKVGF